MNRELIEEKLKKYDQMQLLRFFDELSETEQEGLLKEIDRIDFDVINIHNKVENKGAISPLDAMTLSEIEVHKKEL
ncbi:MAG: UDPGP type 1 family protein, partial [Parasporobacterium sp.]|nr:UDPGP type 1 family protein [Parasporobacterium sp.]